MFLFADGNVVRTLAMGQKNVIAFLSSPASYGPTVARVERHETHGALVFLAGDFAYKLKRSVRFPYMDYSTLKLRRAACEAELAVNRRMAPQLYLGVRAIVRNSNGKLRFGTSNESGAVVDWVVVMHRFPQNALLERMRENGKLTVTLMRRLAEVVADFHASAEVATKFGGEAGIARVVEENVEALSSFRSSPFRGEDIKTYSKFSRQTLVAQAKHLETRRASGLVRRCHGDLHLNNVCLIDGEPVLFDAIEFSEDFSCIDVFYDLAFLLMDLDHNRERVFANVVLNRYLEKTDDFGGLVVLPLFLSCRAAVRAHVKAAQAAKADNRSPRDLFVEANSYLKDAIRFLRPSSARLVVLGGLSGTGKSTLGRAIAPGLGVPPGAIMLRSDVLRKKLCGVRKDARLPDAAYSADVTKRVYRVLQECAQQILAAGYSVVVDAVYGLQKEREAIANVASATSVPLEALWLEAPLSVLEGRVAARKHDASDANVEVLHRQQTGIVPPRDWQHVDAGGTPDETLRRARAALKLDNEP